MAKREIRGKMWEVLCEFCQRHGLPDVAAAELLGMIATAEIIDAVEYPELAMELAVWANGPSGKRLRRMSKAKRRQEKQQPRTVQV